jgi:hypothetical protein
VSAAGRAREALAIAGLMAVPAVLLCLVLWLLLGMPS